jgi:hypothetical protein
LHQDIEGKVWQQAPAANTEVAIDSAVQVKIGPAGRVEVPQLYAFTEEEAREALTNAGLVMAIGRTSTSPVAPMGVTDWHPSRYAFQGDTVTVELEYPEVPDVQGKDKTTAVHLITSALLNFAVKEITTDQHAAGKIFKQSPGAGEQANFGDNVTISMAKAPIQSGRVGQQQGDLGAAPPIFVQKSGDTDTGGGSQPKGPESGEYEIVSISVDTEEVEHQGNIYNKLKGLESATVVIRKQGREQIIDGQAAVGLLLEKGYLIHLSGVGIVTRDKRKKEEIAQVKEDRDQGEREAGDTPDRGIDIVTGPLPSEPANCNDVIKQYYEQCEKIRQEAIQRNCERGGYYSGCALDVVGCMTPYLPDWVFVGEACSNQAVQNCAKGAYGSYLGCIRGCNSGQRTKSLQECAKDCGEDIKAKLEQCSR